MFQIEQQLPDDTYDLIGAALSKFQRMTSWNNEKKKRLVDLQRLLERHGYVSFFGHYSRYHLQRIGEACQYDVPKTRQGHLKRYRGERVRLVCLGYRQGSSYQKNSRLLMVGVVARPD
jgi:hypothetical protein